MTQASKMLQLLLVFTVLWMPLHGVYASMPMSAAHDMELSGDKDSMGSQDVHDVSHNLEHDDGHDRCSVSGHCCVAAISSLIPIIDVAPNSLNILPMAQAITVVLPTEIEPPRSH